MPIPVIRLAVPVVDHLHLKLALVGLTAMNRAIIKAHQGAIPSLYESGVRWRPEAPDQWETLDIVLARGFGDCEDLSTWRAAELQEQGVDAEAEVYNVRDRKWHAVVLLPDGTIEDPSARLGMLAYARHRRDALRSRRR